MKDKTVKFMGVEMSEVQAAKMAELNPELVKSNERKQADSDRDKIDERTAPAFAKIDKMLTNLLADPKSGLLLTDLDRIRSSLADDGKVYSEYRHAGRPRSGEPSERFGGFTQSILAAHNVAQFVKLAKAKSGTGWLKAPLESAASGADICVVERIPFAGQAAHDADANHAFAGCERAKCSVVNHGDNADRLTYNQRETLGADGWHVELKDDSRVNLADVAWDSPSNGSKP